MELGKFKTAREVLSKYLPKTRLVRAASLETESEQQVFLKLENELPTGSFKVRGAIYALSLHEQVQGTREVVASSTGNHGAAVAYAAKVLGWRARIFLPEKNNPIKRKNIARLGAAIEERGTIDLADAFQAASEYAQKSGAYFLNDAMDRDLPAGPGTIACEIFEQQPSTDVIYVPMGDTALIRGVADATKQISRNVKIIGVQSERAPSYFLSWREGRAIETETCDTIADGLATRTPQEANVVAIRELVNEVVLVSEEEMLEAIARLLIDEHVVAEPAGAAATAAFLKSRDQGGSNVALLVTGANLSRETLEQVTAIKQRVNAA
jgi:threonine dehydratase